MEPSSAALQDVISVWCWGPASLSLSVSCSVWSQTLTPESQEQGAAGLWCTVHALVASMQLRSR